MGRLFDTIRSFVDMGQYVVSQHAVERLEERGVLEWQVVDGLADAQLIAEREWTQPNPSIEVIQHLADGTPVNVIWSRLKTGDLAKLVTVHYFDE